MSMADEQPPLADYLPQESRVDVDPAELDRFWQRHPQTYELLWKSEFLIYDNVPLLSRPLEVMMQVARGPEYWCDGKYRENSRIRYFCYTLSGIGGFRDQTGSYLVPPGHGFLMETDNPLASYYYPAAAKDPWRYLAFTFHGLQAHVMVRALLREYGPIFPLSPESAIIHRLLRYRVVDPARGRIQLVQIQIAEAVRLVTDLLVALLESRQAEDPDCSRHDLVQRAVTLVTTHTGGDLRVSDVARSLGVSREHLSRVFRRRLGKSFRTFLLEQKVRRACLLLKETDLSMRAISEDLGYTAYSNFSQAFEQLMQMTPREFRQHGHVEALPDIRIPTATRGGGGGDDGT